MKTEQTGVVVGPFAFAIAGEQAKDWAYDQLAKFRPGGKNYNRLRALQAAGEALQEKPDLYTAAPELLEALEQCVTDDGATCFTHQQTRPDYMVKRLNTITAIAKAAIAKATGGQP